MRQISNLILSLIVCLSTYAVDAEQFDVGEQQFSEAELEQMLAPIALYPDSVLSHILIAATYPLEIIQANRWVAKNPDFGAAEALELVDKESWDPSVKALVPFPRILQRLNDDLDWTQKLGDAFLQDEARMLASIQSLRRRADKAGNLDKMENMQISREQDNIIIQPVEREIVYVPYYDTRVVYGSWYWNSFPPVYWDWHWNHHHHYAHHGLYYWHPRVHVSYDYSFSAFHWHDHHIVVIDRHHYRSRHHYQRRNLIANANARRWTHNPTHRRGVAYRSEPIRNRYNSNRMSVNETKVLREKERHIDKSLTSRAKNTRTNQINSRTINSRENKQNINKLKTEQKTVTRQERLRNQLQLDKSKTIQPIRNVEKRSNNDRVSNERINNNRNYNNRVKQSTPKQNNDKRDVYQKPVQKQDNRNRDRQRDQQPKEKSSSDDSNSKRSQQRDDNYSRANTTKQYQPRQKQSAQQESSRNRRVDKRASNNEGRTKSSSRRRDDNSARQK